MLRRHPPEHRLYEKDAIAVCSFGDASANHSTAQGAINAAGWTAVQGTPLPLMFICEDNGIGISTRTPKGWIENSMRHRPGIRYFKADGLDMFDTYRAAREAAEYTRRHRKPAFLHLRTVRLYGHAGADVATSYLPREEVERDEANDPLLHSARLLAEEGALAPEDALAIYQETCARVAQVAAEVIQRPRLKTAADVMSTIIPPKRSCAPTNGPTPEARAARFGSDMKAMDAPQTLSKCLNMALTDLMLENGEIILMGEDVGLKGGVYGVTQKLQSRFGRDRVIDTLLDEQSILGLAIGLAGNGFVPIPEIQFLAYLHNAEDQLRGEAATLPFFSRGQFTNPMVLRIAGLGYQKGFGGHFHNDNSLAVLRDIPGLVIACPSTGADGARMLRECVRLAREENRVVVFVEPIALYPMRDLDETGDGGWMTPYPAPDERIAMGEIGQHGHYLSRQAETALAQTGTRTRIIDIRWLAPLPVEAILQAVRDCAHVLIVDECRFTGGQAEALMGHFHEAGVPSFARVTAEDSFIATGPAYGATLPSKEGIIAAAKALVEGRS